MVYLTQKISKSFRFFITRNVWRDQATRQNAEKCSSAVSLTNQGVDDEKINEICFLIDNREFEDATKLIDELEKDFGDNDSNIITLKMRINLER